jgi:hypothetical protein
MKEYERVDEHVYASSPPHQTELNGQLHASGRFIPGAHWT